MGTNAKVAALIGRECTFTFTFTVLSRRQKRQIEFVDRYSFKWLSVGHFSPLMHFLRAMRHLEEEPQEDPKEDRMEHPKGIRQQWHW